MQRLRHRAISTQGKFEAKIANETVFVGGDKDVTYVARSGQQSGIYSCNAYTEGEVCSFRFAISSSLILSNESLTVKHLSS